MNESYQVLPSLGVLPVGLPADCCATSQLEQPGVRLECAADSVRGGPKAVPT